METSWDCVIEKYIAVKLSNGEIIKNIEDIEEIYVYLEQFNFSDYEYECIKNSTKAIMKT